MRTKMISILLLLVFWTQFGNTLKADVVILKNRKEIKGIITRILDYKTGDNKKTYVIEIMAVAGINQTYTTGAFSFTDIVSLEYKKMVLVSEQIKSYKISTTYYSRINGGKYGTKSPSAFGKDLFEGIKMPENYPPVLSELTKIRIYNPEKALSRLAMLKNMYMKSLTIYKKPTDILSIETYTGLAEGIDKKKKKYFKVYKKAKNCKGPSQIMVDPKIDDSELLKKLTDGLKYGEYEFDALFSSIPEIEKKQRMFEEVGLGVKLPEGMGDGENDLESRIFLVKGIMGKLTVSLEGNTCVYRVVSYGKRGDNKTPPESPEQVASGSLTIEVVKGKALEDAIKEFQEELPADAKDASAKKASLKSLKGSSIEFKGKEQTGTLSAFSYPETNSIVVVKLMMDKSLDRNLAKELATYRAGIIVKPPKK